MASSLRFVLAGCLVVCGLAACSLSNLAVDYLANNIAVDDPSATFAFALLDDSRGVFQTSYDITVVDAATGQVLWTSGAVASNRNSGIPIGAKLLDDTDYTWSVAVTSSSGCDATASSSFSTALLTSSGAWDELGAAWVGGNPPDEANLLRAELSLPFTPVRARLYVSGLGAHKAYLNGALADGHQLGPFTQYQRRTPYIVANVTAMLAQGCNTLGLTLGGGRYLHGPGLGVHRTARVVLSITGPSGESLVFVSSSSTTTPSTGGDAAALPYSAPLGGRTVSVTALSVLASSGPITSDDVFDGERYDARLEQPGWAQCGFVPPPSAPAWLPVVPSPVNTTGSPAGGPMMSSIKVPTVVGRVYSTIGAPSQPYPGVFVADAGQGQAGFCALRIPAGACPAGSAITVSYGESLGADGTVFDCRISTDTYICAGAPASASGGYVTYAPSFSYRGYRYVQVEGYPGNVLPDDALTCYFVHAGVKASATEASALGPATRSAASPASATAGSGSYVSPSAFSSGSALLNSIQHAVQASALSNLMEVPTDDPNRSRAGWLGDSHLAAQVNFLNLGGGVGGAPLAAYYRVWLDTIADTQAYFNTTYGTNGTVPDELPWFSPTRIPGDAVWSAAYPLLVDWLWGFYSDDAVVERHYAGVQWLVEYHIAEAAQGWGRITNRYGA